MPGAARIFQLVRLGLAVVLLAAVATVGPVPLAQAASDGKLVLLLDSSGSMQEKVGGATKISIAKRALTTVIKRLPSDAQTGLRVYGATVFKRSDKGACTDSQLVVPIGTDNRDALRQAVARYRPYGETPISYSLTQAAKDLGGSGRRTVVLVSDGEETCNADPCDTAAKLAKQGIDLKFDVIGLRVSGRARSQLQCIADKGRGTYYDAENAEQIEESLDKLATRAFRPFKLSGTAVQGSTSKSDAPEIVPGQYTDQFPGGSEDLYYSIPRTISGSTVRVGFTAEAAGFVPTGSISLSTADQTSCDTGLGQVVNVAGTRNVVSAEAASWQRTAASNCNTAPSLIVKITDSKDLAGRPFEILVREEPPPVSTRNLAPAEETINWQSMSAGRASKPPVPGSSISDAPVLAPGTYRSTILTGEKQVYGVALDWGQRLQVQVVVPARRGALARAVGVLDSLDMQLLSPMRGSISNLPTRGVPDNDTSMGLDSKAYRVSATTPTVRYLNRTATDARRYAATPGTYSLVLSKSRVRSEAEFLLPYTLVIKVIGTAGDGAPQYQNASPTPTPTPTPTPATSSSASLPPSSAPPGQTAGGVSTGTVVAVGAGALVVGALIALGAWALLRRRRRS